MLDRDLWESVNKSIGPQPEDKRFNGEFFPEVYIFQKYSNEQLEKEYSKRLLEAMKTLEWPYGDRTLHFLAREMKKRFRSGQLHFTRTFNFFLILASIVLALSMVLYYINDFWLGTISIALGSSCYLFAMRFHTESSTLWNKMPDHNANAEDHKDGRKEKIRMLTNDILQITTPNLVTYTILFTTLTLTMFFGNFGKGYWLSGAIAIVFPCLLVFVMLRKHGTAPKLRYLLLIVSLILLVFGLMQSGMVRL
ncbi:MAG: hypothetical protein KGJ59_01110 [Bacteroidota bacterium]|nr:hypothetical protein [Bacteroidota bacterium]